MLAGIIAAHNTHIPYENLDPLTGVPVVDLSPTALAAKMVARRRGGYCFEQNNLMRYALTEVGFDVQALMGRVVWQDPAGLDGPPHPETHQTLVVRVPGDAGPYLVDVGFGGQTLTSPIRLVVDEEQQTRHEPYRLRRHGSDYLLETKIRGQWRPMYTFGPAPRPLIDAQVSSWYVSTYPESQFVRGVFVSAVTDDARWNLRGRTLTVHHLGGDSENIELAIAADVVAELTGRFGIDVSGLGDLEAAIAATLN